jgi:hypothetical protein
MLKTLPSVQCTLDIQIQLYNNLEPEILTATSGAFNSTFCAIVHILLAFLYDTLIVAEVTKTCWYTVTCDNNINCNIRQF